jgi:hypothetical protein
MDQKAQQPHKTVTVSFEEKAYIATYSAGSHAVTVYSITGPETNSGHERYGLGGTSIDSQESTAKLLTLQFLEERKNTADRAVGPSPCARSSESDHVLQSCRKTLG